MLPPRYFAALLAVTCSACLDWTKEVPTDGGADAAIDAGLARDGASPTPMLDGAHGCAKDEDCGDISRFFCTAQACAERECHADKPCGGSQQCVDHRCTAFVPPKRLPSAASQSSGGGVAVSSRYRMFWTAGAPHPVAKATSNRYHVTLTSKAGEP